MGMAHSTSGRRGFDNVDLFQFNPEIVRQSVKYDTARAMLLRENELRLSDKYEHMYREESKHGVQGYCSVTEKLQLEVIRDFELHPEIKQYGLYVLQTAELLYAEKKDEIRELSLYRKFNRMLDGHLVVGREAPGVSVLDTAGRVVELLPLEKNQHTHHHEHATTTAGESSSSSVFQWGDRSAERPLVLIAGSAS
jgi:hypothetical protein